MLRHTGSNMETVRRSNRASILKYINDFGPVSRKDISDATGLTPAAVTQICSELITQGVLIEAGINDQSSGAGRKKILLQISFDYAYVLSVNIDSEITTIALADLGGNLVEKEKCITDGGVDPEIFLTKIVSICRELQMRHFDLSGHIVAVSVGVPGLVDATNGISKQAYGIWKEEVDVASFFEEQLSLPVYLENNVNALAVAEQYFGLGKEHETIMLIKWGPGVGCAIVIDQQIYEGRHHKAAEMGHFIVDPDGEPCFCGRRGCLETKVSLHALQSVTPFLEEEFAQAYHKSDEIRQDFDARIQTFARVIVNSATILAPNRIVLTGPLFFGDEIRDRLISDCAALDPTWGEASILHSPLSEKEDYIGPVAVCARAYLFS